MARKFYKEVNGNYPRVFFENSAPDNTSLVTDRNENILYMKKKYEFREIEGKALFNDKRAEIYFDYTMGVFGDITDPSTIVKVLELESYLDDVVKYLIRGDWLTAQSIADSLVVDFVDLFTEEFKLNLTESINSFIGDNY